MAHELSIINVGGQQIVEAMYANRPAWHGLGQVFDADGQQAPDSATAISLAHLDWQVDKEELRLARDSKNVANYFGLVRQDTRDTLSVVGNEYQVLQNAESFSFLDSLLPDGIMRYETAFALKGGRGIVLLARMPSVDHVTPNDASLRYLLFNTWHGGGAITVTPTAVRVVCANTLRLALFNARGSEIKLSIRHSGSLESKLATVRDHLATFDAAFDTYRTTAQRLLVGYTDQQARDYIGHLFPGADSTSQRVRMARETKVDKVRQAMRSTAQTLPGVKGTWWALFNAVTEAVDHAKMGRQSRDWLARTENRFISVTSGEGADFKDKALDLALALSA